MSGMRTLTGHVKPEQVEHLTDAELAMEVYLAIIRHDDALSDSDMELFRPAWTMASILRERLDGPFCKAEGCREVHLRSFPWCATPGHDEIVKRQQAKRREALGAEQ